MQFHSFEYAAFLILVVATFWVMPPRHRLVLVVIASYAFYASFGPRLLVLLGFSTAVSYTTAVLLERTAARGRPLLLAGGIACLAYVLLDFKVLADAASTTSEGGFDTTLSLGVPIGLSYYTLQSIGYMVDVYRREAKATLNVIEHAAFVAFFPQLLAGPVLRVRRLLPELRSTRRWPDTIRLAAGAELLLTGLFKKLVLADPVFALLRSEPSSIDELGSLYILLLALTAMIATYFDISGYIDIARGSANLLGIHMQTNYAQPLTRSTSMTTFWRRWQITVMMWFRDYLYRSTRSMVGRRGSDLVPMIVTFMGVGLWHGLSLLWLLWGFIIGCLLVLERRVRQIRAKHRRTRREAAAVDGGAQPPRRADGLVLRSSKRALGLAYVYAVLILSAPLAGGLELADVKAYYGAMLGFRGGPIDGDVIGYLCMGAIGLVLLDARDRRRNDRADVRDPVTVARAVGFAVMIVGLITFSGSQTLPYVYFKF